MGRKSENKEKKMTQITMGMRSEPYWDETVSLCEQLGIPPTKPIKEILRQFMPEWNKLLRKQIEQRDEIEEMKKKLLQNKGGVDKKN